MKWGIRAAKLGREANPRRDKGIAVVVMVDSSAEICLREVHVRHSQRVLPLLDSYSARPESVSKCCQIPANFS
jgi:hypothetical protein